MLSVLSTDDNTKRLFIFYLAFNARMLTRFPTRHFQSRAVTRILQGPQLVYFMVSCNENHLNIINITSSVPFLHLLETG